MKGYRYRSPGTLWGFRLTRFAPIIITNGTWWTYVVLP